MTSPFHMPLLLLLLGAIACLAAITRKYLLNTVTIICGMWFVSVFLASLGLFAIRPYSERVYGIIAIGSVGVAAGDLFLRSLTQRVYGTAIKRSALVKNAAYSLNMRAILCLQIFCTVYYLLMCFKSFQLLHSGFTFADLRTIHQGYANMESSLTNFQMAIGNHVAKSFIFVMIPVTLVILFTGQRVRYRKMILLLTVFDLCMYTLYTASRMILAVAMLNALVLLVINKARVTKRMAKNIKRVGVLVGATVLFVTAFRVTNKGASGIWETIYAYFSAPVPLMSYWIERIDASIRPMNGLALTNGLLNALDIFCKRFNFVIASHQECSAFINSFETFIPVFGGSKINAFVSAFTYFYLDGRELGVFLLGGVMGAVGSYFEERTLKRPDLLSLLTYILLTQAAVKFLFKWEFASSSYVLAFFYLRIVFVKRGQSGASRRAKYAGSVSNILIQPQNSYVTQKAETVLTTSTEYIQLTAPYKTKEEIIHAAGNKSETQQAGNINGRRFCLRMEKEAERIRMKRDWRETDPKGSSMGRRSHLRMEKEMERIKSERKLREADPAGLSIGRRRGLRMAKEAEGPQMERRRMGNGQAVMPMGRRCRRRREIELYRSRVSELMRLQRLSTLHNRDKIRIVV